MAVIALIALLNHVMLTNVVIATVAVLADSVTMVSRIPFFLSEYIIFNHFSSSSGAPGARSSGPQVCRAFQRGQCDRGSSCRYAHEGGSAPSGDYQSRERSTVCFRFQRGECDRGDSCRFTHDANAAASSDSFTRGPCHAFKRGECTRGDTCRYSHEGGDAAAAY